MKRSAKILAVLSLCLPFIFGAGPNPYRETTVAKGAAIQGVVKFLGKVPAPKKILISKNNEQCGNGNREIQWVAVADGNRLRNVAVYIAKIDHGKKWNHPKNGYMLDQQECRFLPDFFAVPKGETLRILNSDPILHNIHTYEIVKRVRRTMFNEGQPYKGFEFTKRIHTRRSNIVKIECDAHNFMHAWIFVPENPYYDLVNEEGEFAIDDIPAGSYVVKAWHPTLGEKVTKVTLAAGQKLKLDFEFSR